MSDHKPISTIEADKILSMPPVAGQLPYRFANGSFVEGLAGNCISCGKEIAGEDLRGEVFAMNTNSVTVTAYAICYDCKLITPVECRFADDGTYLSKTIHGWVPGRYAEEHKPGFLHRLIALLKR